MPTHAFTNLARDFSLNSCPTDVSSKDEKDEGQTALAALQTDMADLQDKLYASRKGAILLVLQGMDTSGKDGTIRRIFSTVSPQGLITHAFKQPTPEELAHDFLWRAHLRVPERGYIGIFNRSYYEALVSDLVEGIIDEKERDRRCQHVRDFEAMLLENGTTVLKCFLHIGKAEQKDRLVKRLEDPGKRWKFSASDLSSRARWDAYISAWSTAIAATSTAVAPWHVIPADRKWYRDLAVAELMTATLRTIAPRYPTAATVVKPSDIKD
jgi:PPK2 family polyphosphate:nucleotide phosphotransferase